MVDYSYMNKNPGSNIGNVASIFNCGTRYIERILIRQPKLLNNFRIMAWKIEKRTEWKIMLN